MPNSSSSPLPHSGQPAVNVLVVDDQPMVIESICQLLASEADIAVTACHDPTRALSMAAELKPTVILQDLVMPDVDGLTLMKFFRAHPLTKEIPVIVLSSKEDAPTKAISFAAGANDYLVKLPDPIELIARLRYHSQAYVNLLKRNEAEQTLVHNKVLEERVEERTRELRQTLDSLKQAQSRLVHNEKMTSLSQLVAGIAHEVNNPINVIYGNLNYMNGYVQDLLELIQTYQEHYPEPAPPIVEQLEDLDLAFTSKDLLQSFDSLRNGAKRIRDLVLSLRNFSRFDEAELKTVNIQEGIDSALAMLSAQLDGIEIKKDYGKLPKVNCYAGQLNQVFMHLITNALEALRLDSAHDNPSPQLHISTMTLGNDAQAKNVSIWIADNGPGISPNIQDRIFDPFFTTKAVGEGTGLGLSISHQIVTAQHGGLLKCYSVPGQGAKFLIELPVSQQAAQKAVAKRTDSSPDRKPEQKTASPRQSEAISA
ncbi:MAG: response regulator [Cyanobacteria bacterium P01_D01_bin.105]